MDYKLLHQIVSKSEKLRTTEKPKKALVLFTIIASVLVTSFLCLYFDAWILIQLIIGFFLFFIYIVAVFSNAIRLALILPTIFLGQVCSSLLIYAYILLNSSTSLSISFISMLVISFLSGFLFRKFYALAQLKFQLKLRQFYISFNTSLLCLLGLVFIYSIYLEYTQALKTLALYDRIFVYMTCCI